MPASATFHTIAQWEEQKPSIRRFYVEQKLPLRQVKVLMMRPPYNFNATDNQYKKRFRKWGWGKNRRPTRQESSRPEPAAQGVTSNQEDATGVDDASLTRQRDFTMSSEPPEAPTPLLKLSSTTQNPQAPVLDPPLMPLGALHQSPALPATHPQQSLAQPPAPVSARQSSRLADTRNMPTAEPSSRDAPAQYYSGAPARALRIDIPVSSNAPVFSTAANPVSCADQTVTLGVVTDTDAALTPVKPQTNPAPVPPCTIAYHTSEHDTCPRHNTHQGCLDEFQAHQSMIWSEYFTEVEQMWEGAYG